MIPNLLLNIVYALMFKFVYSRRMDDVLITYDEIV